MRAKWSGRRIGSGLALVALVGGIVGAQLATRPQAGYDWAGYDWAKVTDTVIVDAPTTPQNLTVAP
ncbi:hypothetical protein [Polymorphospora rubra]|uniref:Uncharacterized protein n=1 Tax=Polymorphospora rubra TaxID=338584 RepID=A0A810MUD3_9ACTN|nr:hypothetical protein [Polymorphospora rubra]BCJ64602.1 hypothetical protein Prubr_16230 [Polymorphospora rubra]